MENPQVPEVAPLEPASIPTDNPTPETAPIEPEAVVEGETEVVEPEAAEEQPESPTPELPPQAEVKVEPEKERLKGAIDKIASQGEELKAIVDLQSELVSDNPELIHQIALKNPLLANRIVEKVWGESGIRSYKQLTEYVKLEAIKDSNPDLYETKKEMLELKAELNLRREKEIKLEEESFLKSKGIMRNEYDPNYKKVQEALNMVDAKVRKNDPKTALKVAYSFAFADAKPVIVAKSAPSVASIGGGAQPPVLPASTPAQSSDSAWLGSQLAALRGVKKL